jgi:hypothetical protein
MKVEMEAAAAPSTDQELGLIHMAEKAFRGSKQHLLAVLLAGVWNAKVFRGR